MGTLLDSCRRWEMDGRPGPYQHRPDRKRRDQRRTELLDRPLYELSSRPFVLQSKRRKNRKATLVYWNGRNWRFNLIYECQMNCHYEERSNEVISLLHQDLNRRVRSL